MTDGQGGFLGGFPDRDNHCIDALRYAYLSGVDWEDAGELEARLPRLLRGRMERATLPEALWRPRQ